MEQKNRRPGKGDGSIVALGGQHRDLNSGTPHTQGEQLDPIRTLRSWETSQKLKLRHGLNNHAVYSASRATRTQSPHARVVFWIVNETAANWTFATANDEQLKDILHGLNLLMCGADALDRNASGA